MAATLASAGDALARSGEALTVATSRTVETSRTTRIASGRGVRIKRCMQVGPEGAITPRRREVHACLPCNKRQIAAKGRRSYSFGPQSISGAMRMIAVLSATSQLPAGSATSQLPAGSATSQLPAGSARAPGSRSGPALRLCSGLFAWAAPDLPARGPGGLFLSVAGRIICQRGGGPAQETRHAGMREFTSSGREVCATAPCTV